MTHAIRAAVTAPRIGATDGVATKAQLHAAGVSDRVIANRCRPGGPWRRLTSSVVLLGTGSPTRMQLLRAAVGQFGRDAVLTGFDALDAHGVELPPPRPVHVLVPGYRRMLPPEWFLLERTARPPDPVWIGGLPFAPPERAALDAARRESDPEKLRKLLALPVHQGLCTAEHLHAELDRGNQRGSAAVRLALRELGPMRDVFLYGPARRLVAALPMPAPSWDVTICDLRGTPIGAVDAWWDEAGMGWQFGSPRDGTGRLHHLALTAAGVVLVRSTTDQLRTDPDGVRKQLARAFRTAARRPRPAVESVRAVAA
ncbi:hypothetical protein [Amycolatopsis cihanbeyliensis]|uniref:Uncharacterized protein n=1 Tax=Amycolatopsis cihanbeyliensis TaxID=1128664 RepID=A0A542DPV8_AMYCI|nr:hypothetical protein [Amycolatopsis cihanbeyliensis]TQJ04995.1 hypothetical protein FB471_4811 [Amycolatopsis cihanbeyliensis]